MDNEWWYRNLPWAINALRQYANEADLPHIYNDSDDAFLASILLSYIEVSGGLFASYKDMFKKVGIQHVLQTTENKFTLAVNGITRKIVLDEPYRTMFFGDIIFLDLNDKEFWKIYYEAQEKYGDLYMTSILGHKALKEIAKQYFAYHKKTMAPSSPSRTKATKKKPPTKSSSQSKTKTAKKKPSTKTIKAVSKTKSSPVKKTKTVPKTKPSPVKKVKTPSKRKSRAAKKIKSG